MLGKKVKSRIFFSTILVVLATITIFITLKSLEENVVYFYSPTDIYKKPQILSSEKNLPQPTPKRSL